MKRTICVDFDGTLCDFEYPGIGQVKEGAREALTALRRMDYHILIYSCRTSGWHHEVFGGTPGDNALERPRVRAMIAWLNEHDIPYDEVDDGTKGKPLADYMIDDKGVRFEDNWKEITDWIAAHIPPSR
jgi:hypothetical protein